MKVVALAGGVGGAKLVQGLAGTLPPDSLSVVVNTGDDFEHLGLRICPDLDTVVYTLAGLADPQRGWGRADESWNFLQALGSLGGPTWFRIGDRDLAMHVERTHRMRAGQRLSRVTADLCRTLGVSVRVLPMSDDPVSTMVLTEEGELSFQEYFVARRCTPRVQGFRFQGAQRARPAPGVLQAIETAALVVFCPSNPWVSLDPILAVSGMRQALVSKTVVAVSPIVGGRAIKGPAAKMFAELGVEPTALAVAEHYNCLLKAFVLDQEDRDQEREIAALGLQTLVAQTIMRSIEDRLALARAVIEFAQGLLVGEVSV